MSSATGDDAEEARELNRLYWGSDRSVNGIADDLGISKGTLYSLLDPLPAGIPCPGCGAPMGYPNRTARDRGRVVCPECGREEDRDDLLPEAAAGAPAGGPDDAGAAPPEPDEEPLPGRIVAGAALLGIAAGLAVIAILRRR